MVAKQNMDFIIITVCIDSSQKILMKSHFIKALTHLIPGRAYLFTVITKTWNQRNNFLSKIQKPLIENWLAISRINDLTDTLFMWCLGCLLPNIPTWFEELRCYNEFCSELSLFTKNDPSEQIFVLTWCSI